MITDENFWGGTVPEERALTFLYATQYTHTHTHVYDIYWMAGMGGGRSAGHWTGQES